MRVLLKRKVHNHHAIPVGKSIAHLEWHLAHLFDNDDGYLGWETIVEMTPEAHRKHHIKVDGRLGVPMKS